MVSVACEIGSVDECPGLSVARFSLRLMPDRTFLQVRYVVAENETEETGANRLTRLSDLVPGSQVLVAFTPGAWTRCEIVSVDLWRVHVRRLATAHPD